MAIIPLVTEGTLVNAAFADVVSLGDGKAHALATLLSPNISSDVMTLSLAFRVDTAATGTLRKLEKSGFAESGNVGDLLKKCPVRPSRFDVCMHPCQHKFHSSTTTTPPPFFFIFIYLIYSSSTSPKSHGQAPMAF